LLPIRKGIEKKNVCVPKEGKGIKTRSAMLEGKGVGIPRRDRTKKGHNRIKRKER